jgi:hypothetical protein
MKITPQILANDDRMTADEVDKITAAYAGKTPAQIVAKDEKILLHYLKNPPQREIELYTFLTALTHEPMPWQSICEDHCTPWDFIWYSYRVDLPQFREKTSRHLIYVGPRGGYKTLSVAKLIAAELLLKRGCWTVGMGAIEAHAKRTYQYVQRYLSHPVLLSLKAAELMTMAETKMWNGSVYNQVCATWAGVNSQHPHKMRTEENDLISDPFILEEAKMMPSSHGKLRAHMSYVSSRKFEDGIMDQLVANADAKGYDYMISCYKDSAEQCTEARHGERAVAPLEVEDLEDPTKTVILPPDKIFKNCVTCPILPSCQGDLARAHGAVAIDDVISDWRVLDRDVWMWQKECKRTRSSATFFQFWNEHVQEGDFNFRPEWGPVDLSFDFTGGGEDPTVMGVWQTDPVNDNDFMIGEKVWDGAKLADFVFADAIEYLQKLGVQSIRNMMGDSAAQTWINELNSKINPATGKEFFHIKPVKKIERVEGWKLMRQRVRDNSGWHHIFANKKECPLFCAEVRRAKKHKTIKDDIPKSCSDHSLDQCRYRLVELRYSGLRQPNIRFVGEGHTYRSDPAAIADQRSKDSASGAGLTRMLHLDPDLDDE